MQAKILSWNIWIDSYFYQVKDFLKKSKADVIGLQEVREDDPKRETIKYMKSLGYKHIFAPVPKAWGYPDGPAIFTKHEIVSTKIFVLAKVNGRAMVQANIKIGNKLIHFFNTHLPHTHQKDSPAQLGQVRELLKHIPAKSSVLMGDFNATPRSSTIQKVKTKLIDTDSGNKPTWSVYPEGCAECNPKSIGIRLDYIFTTKDIKTHSYKVEESKGSDHLPISVIAEL